MNNENVNNEVLGKLNNLEILNQKLNRIELIKQFILKIIFILLGIAVVGVLGFSIYLIMPKDTQELMNNLHPIMLIIAFMTYFIFSFSINKYCKKYYRKMLNVFFIKGSSIQVNKENTKGTINSNSYYLMDYDNGDFKNTLYKKYANSSSIIISWIELAVNLLLVGILECILLFTINDIIINIIFISASLILALGTKNFIPEYSRHLLSHNNIYIPNQLIILNTEDGYIYKVINSSTGEQAYKERMK